MSAPSAAPRETDLPASAQQQRSAWWWIPSLYFGEGMPYVVVMTLAGTMYTTLGMPNAEMALVTSLLYLPWVIKPLWSPIVDIFRTKRHWVVVMQLLIGAAMALVAFTLPMAFAFQISLAAFWLVAFSSATHDIAADGFYLLALPAHEQAAFIGVRSAFYRVAMLAGQGGLVWVAGTLGDTTGNITLGWSIVFMILASLFFVLFFYHSRVLPRPGVDRPSGASDGVVAEFMATFVQFFQRRDIVVVLAFLLLFRFGEAQALKMVTPFLLAAHQQGGLALSTAQVGITYGTIGVISLTLGGLLGGFAISRHGLKKWLWPMMLSVHLPNIAFVYLAFAAPDNIHLIQTAIAVEQFGYGFGFTAFMMYMILVADRDGNNPHKTAHYAICTGFMALGMMLPGMVSGWIQEQLGYQRFFVWVCFATLPSLAVAAFLQIGPTFGKKVEAAGD